MKTAWPVTLGVLHAEDVQVKSSTTALTRLLDEAASRAAQSVPEMKNLDNTSPLALARAAYRAYGANPKRHPPSSEALAERLVRGKGMYYINNIVDINNLVSLQSLWPVGSYDIAGVQGEITLRVGCSGETYTAMDGTTFTATGYPVFADDLGIIGGTSRDTSRTMIVEQTRSILMVIIAFAEQAALDEICRFAANLLKEHAETSRVEYCTIG